MAIARIENNQVVETRTIALSDVPEHKRHLWRNIIGDPPSSSLSYSGQTYEVTATHVVCTWTPLAPSQADYAAAIQAQEFPITELQVALDRIVALEQALGEFATRLNAQ